MIIAVRHIDRDALVLANLKYAENVAKKFRVEYRLMDLITEDEAVSAGYLGMMELVDEFDDTRKVKFSTYCYRRIRSRVIDAAKQKPACISLSDNIVAVVDESPSPHNTALQDEQAARIQIAIDTLPPVWQVIVRMHYGFEGPESDFNAISETLVLEPTQVREIIMEAKLLLARELQG